MQRIALFLLLAHINSALFVSQLDEVDVFDAQGRQVDDINSLYEFIDEVVLGNVDMTPEDEDNDHGQNFHALKFNINSFQNVITIITTTFTVSQQSPAICFKEEVPHPAYFEIPSPPPKG